MITRLMAAIVLPACFLASAGASSAVAAPALPADTIFWSNFNSNTFGRANQAGGNGATVTAIGTAGPNGMVVDARSSKIYWANLNDNTIRVASLDGSASSSLNTAGATVSTPEGLAIDPARGRLYWGNDDGSIGSAKLDGTGGSAFAPSAGAQPFGVAVDVTGQRLFWSSGATIHSRPLDGGTTSTLTIQGVAPSFISGLAVDGSTLYWSDSGSNTVVAANLDGSGAAALSATGAGLQQPYGVAVDRDARRLYTANFAGATVSYVNLDNAGGGVLDTQGATASGPQFPVLVQRPIAAGAPAVAGSDQLSCSQGTWAADLPGAFRFRSPAAYSYQWIRDGADVAGATAATYVPSVRGSFSCRVTAENYVGSATQISAPIEAGPTAAKLPLAAKPQCSDGVDNDGDRSVDSADPGCSSGSDNDESDESVADLVLCGRSKLKLVRVDSKGGRVLLTGVVSRSVGRAKVSLKSIVGKKTKRLTTVKPKSDGTFSASVKAPSRRQRATIRYSASAAGARSPALKLAQTLAATSVSRSGTTIVIKGSVQRDRLGAKRNAVKIRRILCGKTTVVGSARPSRSGAFTVRIKAPTSGDYAFYRAEDKVLASPKSKRYVNQYARGVAIKLGDLTG